jgi:Mlc titration factor MtfA (ptsG expression regulator)
LRAHNLPFLYLLQYTEPEPIVWPFFVVTTIFALVFLLSFVDAVGGPGLNNLVALWQGAFYAITHRFFRPYSALPLEQLTREQRQFLFEQIHFYKHLSSNQRRSFDHRTKRFLASRQFIERDGVNLTDDMKLLISATAVQITFGMRSYMMEEFATIVVYPRAYFSKLGNNYHKGEVNPKGIVVLSWEDFEEGIRIPDDNLNLGLHEFAHVLALQRMYNRRFGDATFRAAFDKLMANLKNSVLRVALQRRVGLRKYALSNPMEFFAVATEAFFENPVALYRSNHVLYDLFCQIYNIDLLAVFNRPVNPLTQ